MQKIFISYSRDDADFALRLAGDLRAQGVPVWLDHLDITVGSRWDHEVEVALRACATLVVLLSPASVSSHNVMDEVSYALEEGKRVIPVMIRDCEIPFRLRRLQRANLMTNYESGLGGLVPILGTASRESPAEAAPTGDDVSASLAPSETMIPDTAPGSHGSIDLVHRRLESSPKSGIDRCSHIWRKSERQQPACSGYSVRLGAAYCSRDRCPPKFALGTRPTAASLKCASEWL